jgi:hypothetical protein
MDLKRFWRHVAMTPWQASRAFPPKALEAIGRAVGEREKRHRGEVRFVVEAELNTTRLWRGLTPRERALELFATMGVWDTAERTGVLVYVLLADRDVEIVADRGISAKVSKDEWQATCAAMEAAFRAGRFEEGAVAGIHAIAALLERHFPAGAGNRNELPDKPVML